MRAVNTATAAPFASRVGCNNIHTCYMDKHRKPNYLFIYLLTYLPI
jgi:hypothetical protein